MANASSRRSSLARPAAILVAALSAALLGTGWTSPLRIASAAADIVVTSAGDDGAADCPGPDCTLRKAIETANAEPDGGPITIGFDAAVFPAASPATIEIGDNPLPAIVRAGTTIDASGAGVRLLSTSQSLSASNDGLVIAADDVTLRGMSIDDFSGAAVRVEGARAVLGGDAGAGQGIRVGGSGTGFALAGSDATVAGNVIGFAADGSAATVGSRYRNLRRQRDHRGRWAGRRVHECRRQ